MFVHIICIPIKEKSAENVQAYLSGILSYKGGNVSILSDSGTEYKNKAFNETCNQLRIKRLFSNLFHPKVNSRMSIIC